MKSQVSQNDTTKLTWLVLDSVL